MSIRFVLGLLIGLMLGASVALTIAPDPRAARKQLWETVRERRLRMARG